MRKAGIDVTYVELPTNKGHMASHADAALWAPILGAFLKRLHDGPASPREDLASLLQWYVDHGRRRDHRRGGDRPLRRRRPRRAGDRSAGRAADIARARAADAHPLRAAHRRLPARRCRSNRRSSSRMRAPWRGAATTIAELEAAIRAFEGCALKRTAKNTVFADGVPGAPVMVVGEAPGADEDRLGKPFVGVSGQLMDRMFAAIGMSRERDLYITNILFWRPPGNRTPTLAEQGDLPRLHPPPHRAGHGPRCWCWPAARRPRPCSTRPRASRGCAANGPACASTTAREVPTLPTFHPAYLLRTPASKRQSWLDLLALDKKLKELGVR